MLKKALLAVLLLSGVVYATDTYTHPDVPAPVNPPDPLPDPSEWSTGLTADYAIGVFVPVVTTSGGVIPGSPAVPWCEIAVFTSGWDVQAEPYAKYAYTVGVVDYGWPGPGKSLRWSATGTFSNSRPETATQFDFSATHIGLTPGWYTVQVTIDFWSYDPMTSTYTWADQTYPVTTDVFVDYPEPYNWY